MSYGEIMELSDDYRDGFVDSLRVDAAQQTSIAAARAERSAGNFSIFHSGVYTACEPCKDDPKKPPLWQVKAARIIHDQGEKMLYFEQASLEFYGRPLVYLPYLLRPRPDGETQERLPGAFFLIQRQNRCRGRHPLFLGASSELRSDADAHVHHATGPLLEAEWRQRTTDGAFLVRGAGIKQWDQGYFIHDDGTPTPGHRELRGSLESSGQFNLSDKWGWGWDIVAPSDKTFFQDYNINRLQAKDLIRIAPSEGISQLYLTGRGDRSYFDARSMYFYGFSESTSRARSRSFIR